MTFYWRYGDASTGRLAAYNPLRLSKGTDLPGLVHMLKTEADQRRPVIIDGCGDGLGSIQLGPMSGENAILELFDKLDAVTLAPHASLLIQHGLHSVLKKLDAATLAPHAEQLITRGSAAVDKLDAATLAPHAEQLIAFGSAAVNKLDTKTLLPWQHTILDGCCSCDPAIRAYALQILGKLGSAVVMENRHDIESLADKEMEGCLSVRLEALKVLLTLGEDSLTPSALEQIRIGVQDSWDALLASVSWSEYEEDTHPPTYAKCSEFLQSTVSTCTLRAILPSICSSIVDVLQGPDFLEVAEVASNLMSKFELDTISHHISPHLTDLEKSLQNARDGATKCKILYLLQKLSAKDLAPMLGTIVSANLMGKRTYLL